MISENQSYLKKLYRELTKLNKKGIISEKTVEKIKDFYGPIQERKKKNLSQVIFGILGTLLISSGGILIVGNNWDILSEKGRICVALIPLAFSILINLYTVTSKNIKTNAWKESISILWMSSIGISIALISQTYHIPGDFEKFLFIWMLMSTPILYTHLAITTLIAYILGSTLGIIYIQSNMGEGTIIWYHILLCLTAPIIKKILKEKPTTARRYILSWSLTPLITIALFCSLKYTPVGIWIPLFSITFSLLYQLQKVYPESKKILKNPMSVLSGIAIWIQSLILSNINTWLPIIKTENHLYNDYQSLSSIYLTKETAILLILTTINVINIKKTLKQKKSNYKKMLEGFGPITLLLYLMVMLCKNKWITMVVVSLFSINIFIIGLLRVKEGIKELNSLKLITGIIIMSSIAILKFFDSELPIAMRGIVFVLIGIGLWLKNNEFSKKRKNKNV